MSDSNGLTLRLGTRASLLARTQSRIVADALERAHPGLSVELVPFSTSGDQITDRPLHEVGGKGLFTRELELALLEGRVDFAVHSFKDLPTTQPLVDQSALIIGAVPLREDPRDVLVSGTAGGIESLPPGAVVGTGSLRRRCQLLSHRPDLQITSIRGNIDTRLRKQREGQFDAVVLALAGLRRAGLFDSQTMTVLDPADLLPAPGQGALAVQCRKDDRATQSLLRAIDQADTALCVAAERELVLLLNGDCLSPIAALATIEGDRLTLTAKVGARSGRPPILSASGTSLRSDPRSAARAVYDALAKQGVMAALHNGI